MQIIDEPLLNVFRAKRECEWCHKKVPGCEPHHIFARGMGGGNRQDVAINLIGLCTHCHRSHHDGNEPLRCDLLALVAQREGKLQDEIVSEIKRLRRESR